MPLLVVLALLMAGPRPGSFVPPVAGPITAPFVAPACMWCPGHRGVTYATRPGGPVVAAAGGTVTFAGTVAGVRYVVIGHAGALRTTYGRLQTVDVTVGQVVRQGETVGSAGAALHFGARLGDRYVDPTSLFGDPPRRPRLLPLRT
jgi:murein DD-endopeptidase MepM/ murein hydrolase activator NlpD